MCTWAPRKDCSSYGLRLAAAACGRRRTRGRCGCIHGACVSGTCIRSPLRVGTEHWSGWIATRSPQGGIFALGTASHAYLEFDASAGEPASDVVQAVASLREPRTTMGGVNLVAGFRPELWREAAARRRARRARRLRRGPRRRRRLRDAGHAARRRALALGQRVRRRLRRRARGDRRARRASPSLAEETSSWPYRHDLDLTGFIDGTENPTLIDAPELVLVPEGEPGAGGTILLLQKWAHDAAAWESLPVAEPGARSSAGRSPTASSSSTSRTTRTSRAPTRTASARSSAATCRTAP